MVRRMLVAALFLLFLLQTGGCYYLQAVRGHSELMSRRRPVAEIVGDENVPEEVRAKLELVTAARDFAVSGLLLPDNDSYRSYADLERDYVVWNVIAAPEFSLQPKTWCYPVAGCVAYRGYFDEDAARRLASRLSADGFDVAVVGAIAYSTLGRFADPVLNTMLRWSDVGLVATMFHELAHQQLYVKGDTAFNESYATAVAEIGIEKWLHNTGQPAALDRYREWKLLQREVFDLIDAALLELQDLYGSGVSDEEKRRRKRSVLDALSSDAAALYEAYGQVANNLAPPLNNAKLLSMQLYEGHVDAFKALHAACNRDLECFYAETAKLADLDQAARQRELLLLSR